MARCKKPRKEDTDAIADNKPSSTMVEDMGGMAIGDKPIESFENHSGNMAEGFADAGGENWETGATATTFTSGGGDTPW